MKLNKRISIACFVCLVLPAWAQEIKTPVVRPNRGIPVRQYASTDAYTRLLGSGKSDDAPPAPAQKPMPKGQTASGSEILAAYGIEMIPIPAGPFPMGDADQVMRGANPKMYNPPRTVTLSAYSISKNVITVEQYSRFVHETNYPQPPKPVWGWLYTHPIVNVSWNDANAFCKWLSQKTGLKIKLPTEAQWEKAARGVDGLKYPWGNDYNTKYFQHSRKLWEDAGKTAPVGSFPEGASPYGVLDMAGNVWQWCRDVYIAFPPNEPTVDPQGPELDAQGHARDAQGYATRPSYGLRGGSWREVTPNYFVPTFRSLSATPDAKGFHFGFRIVAEQ